MKYVITFILGAVCGVAAFIFLCCVAVGKMAEEEDQRLREKCREEHRECEKKD